MTQVSLYLPSRTNLKVHNISQWHADLFHQLKSYGISGQIFGRILSLPNNSGSG